MRATEVRGRPSSSRTMSLAASVRLLCTRTPRTDALRRNVVTSIRPDGVFIRSSSAADARKLSAAASGPPQARIAAQQRPMKLSGAWSVTYTPR